MTIKEFAALCNCNPQTLRYYDRIDLLKPAKVDEWTGYRYYEEKQALDFVKIKHFQDADFSIEEIKEMLKKSEEEIYDVFEQKVREQERRLLRIQKIQQSYISEKKRMSDLILDMEGYLTRQLAQEEIRKQFGLTQEDCENLISAMTCSCGKQKASGQEEADEPIREATETLEQEEDWDFGTDSYEIVYETHGWDSPEELLDKIPKLDPDKGYNMLCEISCKHQEKLAVSYSYCLSYCQGMLAAVLKRNEKRDPLRLGCTVIRSKDQENHFYLKVEK